MPSSRSFLALTAILCSSLAVALPGGAAGATEVTTEQDLRDAPPTIRPIPTRHRHLHPAPSPVSGQNREVEPIGPKLAEGRDSEIFEHGPGRVLRVARDGRSLVGEAEIMEHVRSHGYPTPPVHDAGDGYLVMDRLDGPTMMEWVGKSPFPLRRGGHLLASLHDRLHRIVAPAGLREAPLPGDRVVHRDLHPMNVIMTTDGPVVIDWSNASAGDPAFDLADTWLLFAAASAPTEGLDRIVVPIGRRVMLRAFLNRVDREGARGAMDAAVAHRLTDQNLSADEHARMKAVATRVARR